MNGGLFDFDPELSGWLQAEREMEAAGHALDKIPRKMHDEHIWSDGLILFWIKNRRLPDGWELADQMFDEWDDPVGVDEADEVLKCLTS